MTIKINFKKKNISINLKFENPLFSNRVKAMFSHTQNQNISVLGSIDYKSDGYHRSMMVGEKSYTGIDIDYYSEIIHFASKYLNVCERKLNCFEKRPDSYVQEILEYSDCQLQEGVTFTLPFLPSTLPGESARSLLVMISTSGTYGDLSDISNAEKLTHEAFQGLVMLAEKMDAGLISRITTANDLAELIRSI